jgi:hypothetical protein
MTVYCLNLEQSTAGEPDKQPLLDNFDNAESSRHDVVSASSVKEGEGLRLLELPDELISRILEGLSARDLCALIGTCRDWREVCLVKL